MQLRRREKVFCGLTENKKYRNSKRNMMRRHETEEPERRRTRRSSGRAYAELMRGREENEDDAFEYRRGARRDTSDDSYEAYDAYEASDEYDDGYGDEYDEGEFEEAEDGDTEWDLRAQRRSSRAHETAGRSTHGEARSGGTYGTDRSGSRNTGAYGAADSRRTDAAFRRGEREERRRRASGTGQTGEKHSSVAAAQRSAARPAVRRKRKSPLKWIVLVLLLLAAYFFGKNLLQGRNWTIAVFGVDSRDGAVEQGTRSDVIMLVNVDKRTGDIKLASVYRDTYLKIGDGKYSKINAAYEKGGHEQAIRALEENLDVKIDDYMTFSWSAVAKGINALGGVDLEISDAEFYYINAFITSTVESTGIGSVQLEHAGMNHLDGVQAVAYGRLRLMDTDFNRTARQRKVLGLAMDKAKQADFNTLKNAALAVLPDVSTSIGIDDIVPLLRGIDKYQLSETSGFPFSLKTEKLSGQDYVIPTTLESNVVELHKRFFGEEAYTAPVSVKKISEQIGADSGYTEPGQEAPDFGTGGGSVGKKPAAKQETPQENAPAETEAVTESSAAAETESESETESSSGEAETGEGLFDGLFGTDEDASEEDETTEEAEAPEGGPAGPEETRAQETKAPANSAETQPAPGGPQISEKPETPKQTEAPKQTAAPEPETAGPGANLPGPDAAPEGNGNAAGPGGAESAGSGSGEVGPGV